MHESTEPISLVYLNAPDVAALALTDDEILDAVAAGLRARIRGAIRADSAGTAPLRQQ